MMILIPPYELINQIDRLPSEFSMGDHLGGFDLDLKNNIFTRLDDYARNNDRIFTINVDQFYPKKIHDHYKNLQIKFDYNLFLTYQNSTNNTLVDYKIHPKLCYKNFLCSFNGSPHTSRKFLVAALHRWGYFSSDTCSKNFRFTLDKIDGHLADYLDQQQHRFYRKFFIDRISAEFFESTNGFGYVQYDHAHNIYNLEHQLTSSFLHVVSETMATSYYPFVTEKFLYSVVTRGLFVAYAQPGWHDHLARHYGFRRYDRVFDYRFDSIANPVERLVEMMSMISKFSVLSSDDWRDLYEMELDTIEYNYDHYFSQNYLKCLEKFR